MQTLEELIAVTPLFAELFGQSVELPSDATRRIGQAARAARTWVCMGINERDGGTLYNTLAWFDDQGRLVARHRKLQPTNAERTIWGPAQPAFDEAAATVLPDYPSSALEGSTATAFG